MKYGWKKGEGIGKDGTGIKTAIRVSAKTDLSGVCEIFDISG